MMSPQSLSASPPLSLVGSVYRDDAPPFTNTTKTEKAQTGTQTLLRGLAILEATAAGARDLKSLGLALGMTRSTTHRLVSSLVHERYLRHGPHGIALGPRLIELGAAALDQMPLTTVARPHLEALAAITRDTVHLGVRDGDDVLYVHKIAGTRGLEMRSRVGHRMPLATTGIGRALSLELVPEEWLRLHALAYRKQVVATDAVATDSASGPASLSAMEAHDLFRDRRDLDQKSLDADGDGDTASNATRFAGSAEDFVERMTQYAARGCSLDIAENEAAIFCVAAPIRDAAGAIVAAISVASTAPYMPPHRLEALIPIVQQHSRAISEELGWRPSATSRTIRR